MGRELFVSYPAFRESVTRMDEVFQKITGKSLINTYGLFGGKAAESLRKVHSITNHKIIWTLPTRKRRELVWLEC